MNQKLIKGGPTSHLPFHTSNRGITLIALVITIIVLLILAGVTLSMVLDDNGIIAQAQNAGNMHEAEAEKEDKNMTTAEVELDKYAAQAAGQIQSQTKVTGVIAQKILDENGNWKGDCVLDEDEENYLVDEKNPEYNNEILSLRDALREPYVAETTIVMDRNAYITKYTSMRADALVKLDLNGNNIIFTDADKLLSNTEMKILDSSSKKTGKIIFEQKPKCAYNETCDLNNDGVVCLADRAIAEHIYLTSGANLEKADITGDGIVDLSDMNRIVVNLQYVHIFSFENWVAAGTGSEAPQENYIEQGCPHHRCYTAEEYYQMAKDAE